MRIEDGGAPGLNGLPVAEGMSISHWLQTVRSDPLLDHRTTRDLPDSAEAVVIGSGILSNEGETLEALIDYVRTNDVQCDLWTGKTLDVLMDTESASVAAKTFTAFAAAGGDTSKVEVTTTPAEAAKKSRLPGAQAAYAWDAATLHPWKLVAHVIRQCLDLGLNLQTWTPATTITGSAGQWIVHTPRGAITATTVIHATNAYAGALLPEIRGIIEPMPHMCNRVIPPSTFSGSQALQNSYAVIYKDALYSVNPRSTSDGNILIGGSAKNIDRLREYVDEKVDRKTDDRLVDFEPITTSVRQLCDTGFQWDSDLGRRGAPVRYDHAWSGILGMSADTVPFVGTVPGKHGQWMCCGHNGHGMARIFTCAPALAKLIGGATWADTELPDCFQVTKQRLAWLATVVSGVDIRASL
ncbi:hypothetical protein Q8F55_007328 [Vanrija albida]|uniref:FAD dependent oxidoreductase domain-containing protein n=1 Tax=Vanrija albida TaxID=181172 RepID=A0ABR3PZV2_9TREE